jgi:hypothetical protein
MSTRQATVAPMSGARHGHGPRREPFLRLQPGGCAVAASPAYLLAAPRTAGVAGSAR